MNSSLKLFLILILGFIFGVIFQRQLSTSKPLVPPSINDIIKDSVDASASRYIKAGLIDTTLGVYGAAFTKTDVENIQKTTSNYVYVRIGLDAKQTLYIGNDKGYYITPDMNATDRGYCPTHCPWD